MKLLNWIARYSPRQLVYFDPVLRFPEFLTDSDLQEILSSGNSVFWEISPLDISLFDYAYIDSVNGLVYSNKNSDPGYLSFHFSSLSEDRLLQLKDQYPDRIIIDFLYVSMRIV